MWEDSSLIMIRVWLLPSGMSVLRFQKTKKEILTCTFPVYISCRRVTLAPVCEKSYYAIMDKRNLAKNLISICFKWIMNWVLIFMAFHIFVLFLCKYKTYLVCLLSFQTHLVHCDSRFLRLWFARSMDWHLAEV